MPLPLDAAQAQRGTATAVQNSATELRRLPVIERNSHEQCTNRVYASTWPGHQQRHLPSKATIWLPTLISPLKNSWPLSVMLPAASYCAICSAVIALMADAAEPMPLPNRAPNACGNFWR